VLTSGAGVTFVYGPPDIVLRYTLYPTTAEGLGLQERSTLWSTVAMPDPVRVSSVGVLAALLLIEIVPDAAPLARGVKVRVNDALWPAAITVGSENPPMLNSELVAVADETVTLDPVAVRVAVRVLLVPTVTLPKVKAVGLDVSWPAEMPVPDRAMVRKEFEAFETTLIPPLVLPPALGVKKTVNVTLCPLFRLNGRLKPLRLNPAPVTTAWEIVTVDLPELVKVSYCPCLLPT
jgi:hypothetical protein